MQMAHEITLTDNLLKCAVLTDKYFFLTIQILKYDNTIYMVVSLEQIFKKNVLKSPDS